MTFDELRSLDLRDLNFAGAGDWPVAGRVLLLAVALIAVLGIGYFGFLRGKLHGLAAARGQEVRLKHAFEHKQRLAAEYAAYQHQLAQLRRIFAARRRALPRRGEMDGLLRDLSRTAHADGLTQKLFQPGAERLADFYAEQPIAMEYLGSYPQVARFVSDVSALPRIVSLRSFSLRPVEAGDGARLVFRVTAVTYRYLGTDHVAQDDRRAGSRE